MGKKYGKFPSRVKKNKKRSISNGRKLYWKNKKQANLDLSRKNVEHDHYYCSVVATTELSTVESINNQELPNDLRYSVNETNQSDEVDLNDSINEVVEESIVLDEFSFISKDEYDSIMQHEIPVESVTPAENPVASGNRIVDLQHVLSWSMKLQLNHSKKCSVGQLQLIAEQRSGLVSILTFKCDFCGYETQHSTHKCQNTKDDLSTINVSAVWSTLSTGNSYSNLTEKLSIMDIAPMPYSLFSKIENYLSDAWENNLQNCIEKAGKEEYDIALKNGQVYKDGNAWVTVYTDGGWSHRSFGHSYNASSGVAIVIGKATGKILFLGVRNKYCSICARAESKDERPPEHICFKNWSGSSGAMEADIIVEAFKTSTTMHNLVYLKFIADGDSTVYAKIRKEVSYGSDVEKIHCTNHAIKNYGKALYKIKDDTTIDSKGRKLLTKKTIKHLEQIAMRVLYINAHGDVATLKSDLANGPNHVFDHHLNCKASYCDNVGEAENSKVQFLEMTGIYYPIISALDRLIVKGHQLIDNETNNRAELFMSILCKFNAGKRLNLTQRGSFATRAHLSGLQYNDGIAWQAESWKAIMNQSPGQNLKKFIKRKERSHELDCKRRLEFSASKHKKVSNRNSETTTKVNVTTHQDYGEKADETILSTEELLFEKNRLLNRLQVCQEDARRIEEDSKGQWDNPFFRSVRKDRLTASFFGEVCRRRARTPCHNLVNKILYGYNFITEATEYGKIKEKAAIEKFKKSRPNCIVNNSGFFIDTDNGYLGASPDGLLGNNAIIEVKCLYKVHKAGITLRKAVETDKTLCVTLNENKQIVLKRTHKYYYQVQGQLNISKKDMCFFLIYVNDIEDLHIEVILRDEHFWREDMLPRLNDFYMNCILTEIVLRRIPKGLKALDP